MNVILDLGEQRLSHKYILIVSLIYSFLDTKKEAYIKVKFSSIKFWISVHPVGEGKNTLTVSSSKGYVSRLPKRAVLDMTLHCI